MKAFFLIPGVLLSSLCVCLAQTRQAATQPNTPQQHNAPGLLTPDQQKARDLAETIYNTWQVSVQRGDEVAWMSCITQSRRIKVRNLIISQRGNFPRDFFNSAQAAPKLEHFQYVGALGGCRGRTLAVTYVGKMQLGDAPAKSNAFVLLFVQENGKWKLDQTRFFDLSALPSVLKRLRAGDINVLREQDGFHPYEAVPAVPAPCSSPELIGKVFVDCPGRAVHMRINSISDHEFDNERRADIISGGLKCGVNTISYTITDSAYSTEKPSMGIGLFVMPETEGNKPICVFDHILDADGTARNGAFSFIISEQQIKAMSPDYKGTPPAPFHAEKLKAKPTSADRSH